MKYVNAEELETVAKYLVYLITNLPKTDPIKHGRWIKKSFDETKMKYWLECSECGYVCGWDYDISPRNYCSNCGSKNEVNE